MARLLLVHHSPTPTLRDLTDAVLAGTRDEAVTGVEVVERAALEASAEDVLAADGYAWWCRRISGITRIFHHFRIDHVLGFYRIYSFPWQPLRNAEFLHLTDSQARALTGGRLPRWAPRPDDTVENQAANRRDGDLRLRTLLAAAGHADVVGEDLGCVPAYVRPHLALLGIAGFHIPHWEYDPHGQVIPPERIPWLSLATYATHDHDPLAALWDHRVHRWRAEWRTNPRPDPRILDDLRRLLDFAGLPHPAARQWPEFTQEIRRGLLSALLRSTARDAVLMLPDLFGWKQRFNMPGTGGGKNWRWRLPMTATMLADDPLLGAELRWFRNAAAASGRA